MEARNAPPQLFLPPELILQIAGFLGSRTLVSFACTSRRYATLLTQSLFARHLILNPKWGGQEFSLRVDMKVWKSEYILNCLRRLPDWVVRKRFSDSESTLLHYAASSCNLAVIQILIERGSDVDATNAYGETPLTNAARAEEPEVLLLLLKSGANPLITVEHESHPRLFTMTLYATSATVVRICIDAIRAAGGIVDIEGQEGILLLKHAIYTDRGPIIRLIFDMGLSPLSVGKRGFSYLHFAVENGRVEACQVIYDAMTSAANGDNRHLTIEMLLIAVARNNRDLVLFFLNAGMDILSPIDAGNLDCFEHALRHGMVGFKPLDIPVQALQYMLRDRFLPQAKEEKLPQSLLNIDLANMNLTVFDLALRFGLKESTEAILGFHPDLRQSKHCQVVDFESFVWRKDDEKLWGDLRKDVLSSGIKYRWPDF